MKTPLQGLRERFLFFPVSTVIPILIFLGIIVLARFEVSPATVDGKLAQMQRDAEVARHLHFFRLGESGPCFWYYRHRNEKVRIDTQPILLNKLDCKEVPKENLLTVVMN